MPIAHKEFSCNVQELQKRAKKSNITYKKYKPPDKLKENIFLLKQLLGNAGNLISSTFYYHFYLPKILDIQYCYIKKHFVRVKDYQMVNLTTIQLFL